MVLCHVALLGCDRHCADVLSLTATQATEISAATVTISNAHRSVRGGGTPYPMRASARKPVVGNTESV